MRIKCEARRQNIVEVAGEVFQEFGFEAASMSEIAARVGGSKATLYSYFSSKEELFVAVVRQFAEAHMREIFALLDAEADLADTLQNFGERFLTRISQPDMLCAHRNLFAEAGKSSVGSLFYERGPLEGLQVLAEFMQQAMTLGKLRPEDKMIAAHHFLGLLKAESLERLLLGVQDSIEATCIAPMVARAVDVFLRAYAIPSPA
ncbi:TetR/AcrR family transcriptional regulator [Uliginosibacterium sp. 31-16]|uniref:TetR/AcrR family transcriptional regulator n=1 Tax=Uliginosibacterium sp. 31-16 TaxID=3068315 RepID=UPI00273D0A87|nr:TetR/AcrR family transcriptional regulator [Uliginosibacterium sp. 31-16]MDP5238864.1 TetR/AcrR family transcriptional regulator [Uliginosibacterium sp. 31-16]